MPTGTRFSTYAGQQSPLVLFARLVVILVIVFCAEVVADLITPGKLPTGSNYTGHLVDSVFLLFISAPFIWMILIRPYRDLVLVEKARFSHLFMQMVDAVIVLNEQGAITACNPAAERLFGVTSARVAGEPVARLITCPEFPLLVEQGAVSAASPRGMDCIGVGGDGAAIPLSISASSALIGRRWISVLIVRDMTARVHAETELRKSEARFRNLADFAPVGIFETDSDGACIFVNRKWCQIAGLSFDEALGNGWVRGLHPDDLERVRKHWNNSVLTGEQFLSVEYRFRTPDMTETWVLGNAAVLRGDDGTISGYMGIIIDITERKRAEQQLMESEDRFRTVFEKSEDAIVLITPGSCTVVDMNATAERLFGYRREEMIGSCFTLFGDHDVFSGFAVCTPEDAGSCQIDHIVAFGKGGGELHLSVRAKVVRLLGKDIVYCSMRDISRRLRMEEEARSIQAQLIHTNKMESLGLLVAGIAHEINNPNNYIMANAQMLFTIWKDLAPLLKEKARETGDFMLGGLPYSSLETSLPEMITAINEGSRRIRNIIGGLKNYSRKDGPVMEQMDINRSVYAAILLLNRHIRRYTDNFVIELAEGLPRIIGSSQQVEQVIINLVMNALQALTSREQKLEIRTVSSADGQSVLLTVADEGCGIPESLKNRVMDPFFTTRIDAGGTGLGLSIARSIIQSHRGTIEFTSQAGRGTVVAVAFPVHH